MDFTALLPFSVWLLDKIADKGFDVIVSKLSKNKSIDTIFKQCVIDTAKKLQKQYPDVLDNSIEDFFIQEKLFNELCKLLFLNQKIDIKVFEEYIDLNALPKSFLSEFIENLKDLLNSKVDFREILANQEIFLILQESSASLNKIARNSSLSLKEIKELRNIVDERLRISDNFNEADFVSLYKNNLLNNLSVLNFIGLGIDPSIKKGKRKNLDKIFIKPLFLVKTLERAYISGEDPFMIEVEREIKYRDIFVNNQHHVILGNPGAGKSLLVKSLICGLIKRDTTITLTQKLQACVPFRIELRQYNKYKKQIGKGIIQYLIYLLENDYGMPSFSQENLIKVLDNNNIILFFDGLDEIFNLTDKINVKNDIENFLNQYPKAYSMITSRIIGYEDVRFDDDKFSETHICSFNEEQISDYVNKWYELEEENEELRNEEIKDFLSKKDNIDKELITNPLFLSLIVILFRNNLKIPESKLEIYQSCTNTLIDKWDANKNLKIDLDDNLLQRKEVIFADLAYWQYNLESLNKSKKITYSLVKQEIAKSLQNRSIADEHNSEQYAELFLDYAEKRSIYFENGFTHKTFWEYYTAYWIYCNVEKKHLIKKRNEIITKNISNPFWFIVLELLFNMIDKDQADCEIMDNILIQQLNNIDSYSFLCYILPNVKNISVKVSQIVYKKAIIAVIESDKFRTYRNEDEIFLQLKKNLIREKQDEIILLAIENLSYGLKSDTFYIFVLELLDSIKYNDSVINFHRRLKHSSTYKNEIEQNAHLFLLDCKININKNKKDLIKDLIICKELFGIDRVFQDSRCYYSIHIQLSIFNQLLQKYFDKNPRSNIIDNLTKDIQRLDKTHGIKITDFITAFLDRKVFIYFAPSIKVLQRLIDLIQENKNSLFSLFYIILIVNILDVIFLKTMGKKDGIDTLNELNISDIVLYNILEKALIESEDQLDIDTLIDYANAKFTNESDILKYLQKEKKRKK